MKEGDSTSPTKEEIFKETNFGKKSMTEVKQKPVQLPRSNDLRSQVEDLMQTFFRNTSEIDPPVLESSSDEEFDSDEEDVPATNPPLISSPSLQTSSSPSSSLNSSSTVPPVPNTNPSLRSSGNISQPLIPIPEINQEALQQLLSMGFSEERSKKALLLNKMKMDAAMEWLFSHDNDPDIDTPLTIEKYNQLVHPQPPRSRKTGAPFVPDQNIIAKLKDMGFQNEDEIKQALQATNNNEEAACAWLLGERDVVDQRSNFLMNFLGNAQQNPNALNAFRNILTSLVQNQDQNLNQI